LLGKVLEFLYTGDYTVGSHRLEADPPRTDDNERPELDTEHGGEPPISSQSDGRVIGNPAAVIEESTTEIDLPASENIPPKAVQPATKGNVSDIQSTRTVYS
jgi:hypothetical protein